MGDYSSLKEEYGKHMENMENITVKIEPQDLISPRKAGGVRAEYPWRVGGTTKRPRETREKKQEAKQSPKKVKTMTILPKTATTEPPKTSSARPPSVAPTPVSKPLSQVMIPVTLKTPCKSCHKMITASSIQELKDHKCNAAAPFICPQVNCGQKLSSKNALQYHQKHCHEQVVRKGHDIMSMSKEMVGGPAQKRLYPSSVSEYARVSPKKTFVCPYEGCNKSYNAKTYLIQHERMHTGKFN